MSPPFVSCTIGKALGRLRERTAPPSSSGTTANKSSPGGLSRRGHERACTEPWSLTRSLAGHLGVVPPARYLLQSGRRLKGERGGLLTEVGAPQHVAEIT